MKNVLKWIAAVVFGFMTIYALTKQPLAALLFALAGAFCAPPVFEMIQQKAGFQFQTWQKYAIVIAAWFIGGSLLPKEIESQTLPANRKIIKKSDYGKEWAFTIDSAVLQCNGASVVLKANNKTYALNGTALSERNSDGSRKYLKTEEIWQLDSSAYGFPKSTVRKSVSTFIDEGLKLCK